MRHVAGTLLTQIRRTDTAARVGGDDFALLLPRLDSPDIFTLLHQIHDAVSARMREEEFPLTCSIGAATFVRPWELTREELIDKAAKVWTLAKETGKNQAICEIVG
jgi:diguanylate cyclase (GGDEF)-like protein